MQKFDMYLTQIGVQVEALLITSFSWNKHETTIFSFLPQWFLILTPMATKAV